MADKVALIGCAGAIGMNNRQEVEIQTQGPDRGNLTPKRQVAPAARAAFNREERLVEVIGA